MEVPEDGDYEVFVCVTKARDYGIVQLHWDGEKVWDPIDGFHPNQVVNTGMLSLGIHSVEAGKHTLTVEIVGAHPEAVKSYMFGLDYLRLEKK